jgi:hypothetical protein
MLFTPIIRSTTTVYSHRFFYGFGVFYSIEQVLVLGLVYGIKHTKTTYSAVVLLMMGANSIRNM